MVVLAGFGAFLWSLGGCVWNSQYIRSALGKTAMASWAGGKTGIVYARSFRRARLLGIINALAAWMFHGRAYAGGRLACFYRVAYVGTP